MDQKPTKALIYGMQRTGTNYLETLIKKNFSTLEFCNIQYTRCLPGHKHFRLYDEKSLVPEPQYINDFRYSSFKEFKQHAEDNVGEKIERFVVVMKNPFSWYLSYLKHAKKNKYNVLKRAFNSHFMVDYNAFYAKWFKFQKEAPKEVIILRYEDTLEDLPRYLKELEQKLNVPKTSADIENPKNVGMSKTFTSDKLNYYKNQEFMKDLKEDEVKVIGQLLCEEILKFYQIQR